MNDCPECGTVSEVTPHFDYCTIQPMKEIVEGEFPFPFDFNYVNEVLATLQGVDTKESK